MQIDEIFEADKRIKKKKRTTPLLNSPFLDEIADRQIFIKAECLQHTGSFKFRGAYSAISSMPIEKRNKGVIAYSSGNHAQGVAFAAKIHKIPATIIMPEDAPEIKIKNTRDLGAEVILYDRLSENREKIGQRISEERFLSLIPPYDHNDVIAGQGTIGLEIAIQAEQIGIGKADVLVCCGGGGLTSGIAVALSTLMPDFVTRPVEPEGFDDVVRSLKTGERQTNKQTSGGLCDAIITPTPGELTFPLMKKYCGAGIVVTDEEVMKAIALAFTRLRIVVEPGGAVALAAALFHPKKCNNDPLIAVVSGGNIDPDIFRKAIKMI
jgi:threonine dehydratase